MAQAKDGMKKCPKCGEIKPVSEFYKHNTTKDGYRTYCKKCEASYARMYYKDHGKKDPYFKDKIRATQNKYKKCVRNPLCPAVGGRGAKFVILTCPICGKEFRVQESVQKSQPQKYCSRDCYYNSRFGKDRPRLVESHRAEINKLLYGIE